METEQYFQDFEKRIDETYRVAYEARKKGLDPVSEVEISLAKSLAEKVVGLIATIHPQISGESSKKISKRILELEEKWGKLDPAICLQIAEEVARQRYCEFSSVMEAIHAGVRIGFAYITLGVVSSPIEGLTEIKIMKTRDGKEYFSPYFSGPVRSAGGTGAAFSLVIIDHLREIFGYSKYDPSEEEVKRTATELYDYHDRITNLQYLPTEEEAEFLAKHLPIQVSGEPSEKLEVSNYKNLERVDTNNVRSGFCLVIGEGVAQKAAKIKRYINQLRKKGFKLSDWNFLDDYIELHKKRDTGKTKDSPTYIQDLVAGRPVFGHPSRSGGFRFRYGRGRISGFSAASIHPATMQIVDGFIATGTQLKIEKPTKGCVVTPCDSIDGPIVRLYDGSVEKIKTKERAKQLYPEIEEIIYLGDMLFPFSDLANRNHILIRAGYVEEWWKLDLFDKNKKEGKRVDCYNLDLKEAIVLSRKYKIPLHPSYIYYWSQININQFKSLLNWLKNSKFNGKIVFPYTKIEQDEYKEGKEALEILGVEHEVTVENVVIDRETSLGFLLNLGINFLEEKKERDFYLKEDIKKIFDKNFGDKEILEIVNELSEFIIMDKAGEFIGSRMGRPEKAKLRKLVGSPNLLFPVGQEGGRLRSVQAACEKGYVKGEFPIYLCKSCKKETIYSVCEKCGEVCEKIYYCKMCKQKYKTDSCEIHGKEVDQYSYTSIEVGKYLEKAKEILGYSEHEMPILIKGVRGMSSASRRIENLVKGILRAKYDLQVNKDGTIRFDATELPLVSFKPKEIGTSVEKLKELGYFHDVDGFELTKDDQIVELMPHDVVLPEISINPDERAGDIFLRISWFVDDLLEKFYKIKRFYNARGKEDLVGQLGVCMAPHNCAGVICRIIGFSKVLGLFASPYMHAAIRRDCDGDEASIMLLGDVLINFSRGFLPSHRGGTQDAPLVLNGRIDAGEVDDQILDFELVREYPIELYRKALEGAHSSEISIETVKTKLKKGKNPFLGLGFTHDTKDFNDGIFCSSYKLLTTMQEKVQHQMKLVEKIRAVDASDTARLIIERHFIKDLRGNLRGFSMQNFRCVNCNEIMRRPPLKGVCSRCDGKIIFTINEGGIKKYLGLALELSQRYNLSAYVQQNLDLVKRYIESIFGRELEKQDKLSQWM